MANNLLQQVEQLKTLIDQARQQSQTNRDKFQRTLKAQYEREKSQVSCLNF